MVCLKEHRRHDDIYTIFITVPFQAHSITDKIIPLQSGSVFYEPTKLTGAQYKHRVQCNGCITVFFSRFQQRAHLMAWQEVYGTLEIAWQLGPIGLIKPQLLIFKMMLNL